MAKKFSPGKQRKEFHKKKVINQTILYGEVVEIMSKYGINNISPKMVMEIVEACVKYHVPRPL